MQHTLAIVLILGFSLQANAIEPPAMTQDGRGTFEAVYGWGVLEWEMTNARVIEALATIGIVSNPEEVQGRFSAVGPDGETASYCRWSATHIFDVDGWRVAAEVTNGRLDGIGVAWPELVDSEAVDSLLSWLTDSYGPATTTYPENSDFSVPRAHWDSTTTRLEVRTFPENGFWRIRLLYSPR